MEGFLKNEAGFLLPQNHCLPNHLEKKWSSEGSAYGCCCSLSKSCLTLCNPMDCSIPGFPVHWVGDAIQPSHSSFIPFFSFPQSFPASGSFPMSQPLASGGQNTGVSAPASVLSMYIQDWFPLGWTGWISLQVLSRVFTNTTVQKHQFSGAQLSLWFNSHIHTWLLEKP